LNSYDHGGLIDDHNTILAHTITSTNSAGTNVSSSDPSSLAADLSDANELLFVPQATWSASNGAKRDSATDRARSAAAYSTRPPTPPPPPPVPLPTLALPPPQPATTLQSLMAMTVGANPFVIDPQQYANMYMHSLVHSGPPAVVQLTHEPVSGDTHSHKLFVPPGSALPAMLQAVLMTHHVPLVTAHAGAVALPSMADRQLDVLVADRATSASVRATPTSVSATTVSDAAVLPVGADNALAREQPAPKTKKRSRPRKQVGRVLVSSLSLSLSLSLSHSLTHAARARIAE
jgi:hypothetical protein